MKRRLVVAGAGAGLLTGCASPRLADFAGATPRLDLREYFNGTVDAWGIKAAMSKFGVQLGEVTLSFTKR